MLKALYDFKATFAKTLSFRENEHFLLHQTNTKQRNWWQVINEKGEIGFVPSNYVEKIRVHPEFFLQFLDDCIVNLENDKPSDRLNSQELILRIKEKRRQAEFCVQSTDYSRCDIDNDLIQTNVISDSVEQSKETRKSTTYICASDYEKSVPDLNYVRKNSDVEEEPIKPVHRQSPVSISSIDSSQDFIKDTKQQQSSSTVKTVITKQIVFELVEKVRVNTKLSHEMSQVAVHTVVSYLKELLPTNALPQLSQIISLSETSLVSQDTVIDETHDATRLKHIFKELTNCKEDSQQRSWMLYEDEHVIIEYITELISILVSIAESLKLLI